MLVLLIINVAAVLFILGMWVGLAVEAFRHHSPGQGLLTVVLPGYVLYFLFVKSRSGRALRLAFIACIGWYFTSI